MNEREHVDILIEHGCVITMDASRRVIDDGAAPDRGYDMFRHLWQCMHYHRRHFRDPDVLPHG
ncbi:amidohydrolase [Caballeronia temeraria]|uniref:Amidohydrolase n=1 Tax=Caballeronia temeraria TaxID=1777137 RepID=A0A158CEN4_9BURK|nr:hypothetical protein [Caballeronia temeraria]SAK80785.1 amidohydrolase [Caballeronia temeraria]